MKILTTYFFEVKYRLEKKMGYANYLSRVNQINTEYSWDKKNIKFVLNVLYNNKEVYKSEKYKDLMEGFI